MNTWNADNTYEEPSVSPRPLYFLCISVRRRAAAADY